MDYKDRCQDCFALVTDDKDTWICDECECECEKVTLCPENFDYVDVVVYRSTIEEHDEDNNLYVISVRKNDLIQYIAEEGTYKDLVHFYSEYTADDTVHLVEYLENNDLYYIRKGAYRESILNCENI